MFKNKEYKTFSPPRKDVTSHRGGLWAFTLAETLITLMVIGVVAALTIPALMQSYQDRQIETAKKKAMTTIGNGFKLMIANNDGTTDGLPLTQCGEDFSCLSGVFHKAFQIGTDKTKTHDGLVETYTKSGDSTEDAGFKWDDVPYIFTTTDGMTYGYLGGFTVVVDVNGEKGPNKICKDVIKLTYGSGTVKDKDKNDENEEVQLCEALDDGIEGSSISLESIPDCGEELISCKKERGYLDNVDIYNENGDAMASIGTYKSFPFCWYDEDRGGLDLCIKLGYTEPGSSDSWNFKVPWDEVERNGH